MPLNLNTTDNNLENQLNSMYGVNSLTNSALGLFKQYAGVGEAVVNIMGLMGIAGFKFNIPEREQIKLQSEITDHYTDENNPVQDHIARKPITITLTGIHGEYFYTVNPIEDFISKAVPALSLVTQFLPTLSAAQQQVLTKKHLKLQNSVSEKNISGDLTGTTLIGGGVNYNKLNGVDLFTIFQDLYKISKRQSRAYLFFEALWERQALFRLKHLGRGLIIWRSSQ